MFEQLFFNLVPRGPAPLLLVNVVAGGALAIANNVEVMVCKRPGQHMRFCGYESNHNYTRRPIAKGGGWQDSPTTAGVAYLECHHAEKVMW